MIYKSLTKEILEFRLSTWLGLEKTEAQSSNIMKLGINLKGSISRSLKNSHFNLKALPNRRNRLGSFLFSLPKFKAKMKNKKSKCLKAGERLVFHICRVSKKPKMLILARNSNLKIMKGNASMKKLRLSLDWLKMKSKAKV